MAALSRRLAALEALYAPVVVEAAPAPDEPAWTPSDRLELSQYARWRVQQLTNMLAVEPGNATWREEMARLKVGNCDRCRSCNAWPMESIRVDRDGSVRCGACSAIHEWLPAFACDYFGHPRNCTCGYSFTDELARCWFWPVLEDEARQLLIGWDPRLEGGSAA